MSCGTRDVMVWSTILHLVVREDQPKRPLRAGKLVFLIAAGGAHTYEQNMEAAKELRREPGQPFARPHLVVREMPKTRIFFKLEDSPLVVHLVIPRLLIWVHCVLFCAPNNLSLSLSSSIQLSQAMAKFS
mmetsp:Transcript_21222/g.58753  ORF Transcript_21222/g.58753 Transcript_21222/m.58753 type:complete len:130 (-) Transcript_21222:577-966(-)